MKNSDWVQKYIDKLLSCDIKNDSLALRDEKMPYINMPFYKYCYVTEDEKRSNDTVDYALENFKNDELYFQNPAKFNDPFDCYLGFSQTQVIRDLLYKELIRKKIYTNQMRKAVDMFFSDETLGNVNADDILTEENCNEFITDVLPLLSASFDEDTELVNNIFSSIQFNNDTKKLFIKIAKNTLTIHDKQKIVDLFFENKKFVEYLKSKIVSEDKDFIIKATIHDMKIKIENNPDSFMNDKDGEIFSSLDFFNIIANAIIPSDTIPELNTVKNSFNAIANEALRRSREIITDQFRITCLSERMDSPLMWSHYANKHYGFCLEYDFTHTMIKRYPDLIQAQLMLFPVNYSNKRPLISKALFDSETKLSYLKNKQLPPKIINNIIHGLLFKSEDWKYEKEWRILQLKDNKFTMKLPTARKVFLGANMEESAKRRVIEIAQKKKIPIFQMYLKMDQYKFDYFKI